MLPVMPPELRNRWTRTTPFAVIGAMGIIGGGVAAAVTGPTDWNQGSWVAAFVVLVVGVAQVGLGFGQGALGPTVPSWRLVAAQAATWNVGCAWVIVGTLVSSPVVVAIGSAVFLAALIMAALAVRGHSTLTGATRIMLMVYRLLLVVLLVSTPIGMVLSFVRHS